MRVALRRPAAKFAGLALVTVAAMQVAGAQSRATRPTKAPPKDTTPTHVLKRETFSYSAEGRRDPFSSLLSTNDIRPTIADVRLVTIIYDPSGRNSVAVLRDLQLKKQYRARVGQTLGRMRVAAIKPREVVFTIEEFGLNRQESLTLGDTTTGRRP